MKKIIFLLFLIIAGWQMTSSQVVSNFSSDPGKYTAELRSFMETALTDEDDLILGNFTTAWDSGMVSVDEKNEIILLSNKLLRKNARPKPHFILFIVNLNLLWESSQSEESYSAWKQGLEYLADNQSMQITEINNYLQATYNLFRKNILNQSTSTQWIASQPEFYFEFKDSMRIIFKTTTITCKFLRDSIKIYETEGIFAPFTQTWSGKGGIVTWERSGFPRDQVYVELGKYNINLRLSEYLADSVTFYNTMYFDFSMHGRLEEKVESYNSPDNVHYPRFISYRDNYIVNNIFPNINFRGGLSMLGSDLIGSGTKTRKARLSFLRNDSIKLIAQSENFAFRPNRLSGAGVEVSIPIGTDSIYHPHLGMNYFQEDNIISLYRSEDFQSRSPYYNNYHRIEMNFDQLRWKLDENRILFKSREGAASGMANFQSDNLFDAQLYARLQGIDEENPLTILRRFSEQQFSVSFKGADFARFMRTRPNQAQQILKRLSTLGFIIYDLEDDIVTTRQKLYDWVYASVDYIDYDVINFISETHSPLENASLDLSTYDLTINGIPVIRLSNAQNVAIFPESASIILKRNRSFQFNGVIAAGLFNFHGKKFFFDYQDFKLDLQDIDSLSLRVRSEDMDAYGRATLLNIQSIIENMTGELLIDQPDNKSGRKNYPHYPVFTSKENSFVYYDDPDIQGGVYEKDRFYFEIFPFTFDSLDNFSTKGLRLDGRFVSADIFPPFEQTLIVQNDNSLGFKYITEPDGMELYGGKGQYYDHLEMSNRGLIGSGWFDYLTSTGKSDNIMFHPDSMFATLSEFEINQQLAGVQFPEVNSRNNNVVFYPYEDQLVVEQGTQPFTILNDSTYLDGDLLLTSSGLIGSGKMELTNSVLTSDEFTYTAYMFNADTADFKLKSLHTDGFTLVTDNVNAHVDFESRSGLFRKNEESTLVEFPENKYISHLDLFIWDMDETLLEMLASTSQEGPPEVYTDIYGEENLIGPRYISIDPLQDSLSFVSTKTLYDYRQNLILASNVTFIKVADAYIYPKDGEVIVKPDGYLQKLEESQILANRQSRLHTIYGAWVEIQGKLKYNGGGDYDYIDETGDKQIIFFDDIQVDNSLNTIASGMIDETQEFTLNPYFGYHGKVTLLAPNPFLTFNGGVKIFHECEELEQNYFKFESEINPEEIYIPVPDQPFDINMNSIYSGIFITRDSSHIYPSFFSKKKLPSDRYIITADGYLFYDKESEEYKIASMEKLHNYNLPGNWLQLPRTDCIEYGEGDIDLVIRLGQVSLSSVGDVEHNMATGESKLGAIIAMDFFMSDQAFLIMSQEIDSLQGLEPFDLIDGAYVKRISEIISRDQTEALQADLGLYGAYQELPEELKHTLFFSRVDLIWNQETRSYRSTGKIGIGNINGHQIHKMVDGYMELSKRRSGDLFDLYLQLDRTTWYYIGYTRGVLHVLSSNREFNMAINNMKTSQRQLKTKRNEEPYIFVITTAQKRDMFLRSFLEESEE
ncbi:MAG: hypothetical protein AMS27_00785 [Bacteroides sp. SM23_62_1]|nr:MAG: hypothetical protein AMS27_00785 [Bacteroides sp. SM23_62_1]